MKSAVGGAAHSLAWIPASDPKNGFVRDIDRGNHLLASVRLASGRTLLSGSDPNYFERPSLR